jgi:Xaa-Pro aminopeptidase
VILHYDKNRRQMESGDVVVMDIGAEYSYYSADVTRTIPVSGKFSGRQREIYDLVLGAQNAAIEAIRPGTTVGELTGVARTWLRENSNGACGQQTCDAYFVHGLGHWLGMDVHDVGDYATPLLPGMVLTIEPGIYLPDENLGVRIEDDVLVTETGHEVLSAGAPRDPDRIEALMRQGG